MKPSYIKQATQSVPDVQVEIERVVKELGEISTGKLLRSIALTTTQTSVPHTLGSVPNGYIVVYRSADARVWDSASPDRNNFYLTASAAVTVTLLVF